MKKIIVVVVFLIVPFTVRAQKTIADSSLTVLQNEKADSLQITSLLLWMDLPKNGMYDSAAYYPTQIIQVGQKQRNKNVEAIGEALLGYYFHTHANRSQALVHFLKALQLGESQNDPKVMLRLYHFMSFYYDGKESIEYQQKVLSLAKQIGEINWQILSSSEIGKTYRTKLQQYDSAFTYLQRAYELNLQFEKSGDTAFSLGIVIPVELGYTFLKLRNYDLASAYFRQGLKIAEMRNAGTLSCYLAMATYFQEAANLDSAYHYAKRLYETAPEFAMSLRATASQMLYQIYKERRMADSALKYHEIFKMTSDSANSITQAQKLQSLLWEEKDRQNQLALEKEKERETRKQDLQYAAIALAAVTFIIFFFLLSHSQIANQRLIKFLGILGLLIVFEFFNLLLHPYIGDLTHHSPVLMLGVMVCIAALLIPIHHRLEHWVIYKLVEKNNKIRLAAAKKTIAKLEG
jgi:tetratricopeptide (TPR) repeat protein